MEIWFATKLKAIQNSNLQYIFAKNLTSIKIFLFGMDRIININ